MPDAATRSDAYIEGCTAYGSRPWPLSITEDDNPYEAKNRWHGGGYEKQAREWLAGFRAAEDAAS